jgi:WS/DGAT/MGAT family acyltransferase
LEGSLAVVDNPGVLADLARKGVDAGMALGKLLLIPPDMKTILRGQCEGIKRAAWAQPIPLEEVKAIGRRYGATVNDVLISTVTGGIRRYMENHQQSVDGVNVRAMIPFNIRMDEEINSLGNKFGLVILSLPVGVSDLENRLKVTKLRMDQIKDTPEATVAFGILNTIGITSSQVENIIVNIFAVKVSAVMTNVIGPKQPIYIAGQMLKGMIFWVPQPGSIALGVSIFSYNNEVVLGVASDESVIPFPEEIVAGFQEEFEALRLGSRENFEASQIV